MKRLKLWNGRGWDNGTDLYVCAYSVKDAAELASEAYRKVRGHTDRPDIKVVTEHEVRNYWNPGCWGNAMDGVEPERGVWLEKAGGTPVRIL